MCGFGTFTNNLLGEERSHGEEEHPFSNMARLLLVRFVLFVAQQMYLQAMRIDPHHHNSIYNYAVLLDSGIKDKHKAEEYYLGCLEVNPKHCFCLYNLAILVEELRGGEEEYVSFNPVQ